MSFPPNLNFMDAASSQSYTQVPPCSELPYRFAHASSLSYEKTAEESYLTCRKSFEDKQDCGVGDGVNHDQHGDVQKSGGVPYQSKGRYHDRCKNIF
jgi:hypothetical protein